MRGSRCDLARFILRGDPHIRSLLEKKKDIVSEMPLILSL